MRRCSEVGLVGRTAIWILIAGMCAVAIDNIIRGDVRHPSAFVVVLLGFVLFSLAKLSVILHRQRISFGTRLMTARMANAYRLGYWLMVCGTLATFT